MDQQIQIQTAFITLGQLLKETGLIDTGGMAKWFIQEREIIVNGEQESRRGRKLFPGDHISITGIGTFVLSR